DLRPVARHEVTVESLARAEAEPETPRIHGAHRRRRLGDDGRMRSERGTGDPGSDVATGMLGGRRHEGPHKGSIALLRGPWLDVIGRHHPGEARGLRLRAKINQLARMELLEHGRIADLCHAANSRP